MKFKFISFVLATMLLLSSSVGAHDMCEGITEVPSAETYAAVDENPISPLALMCDLFGHADPVESNTGTYSQTKCVNLGDDQCQAICYRYKYCSRDNCGENLGYANSGHHVRDGYCIRRMWEQYEASWIYDCTTCG